MHIEVREAGGISLFMDVPKGSLMGDIKAAIQDELDVEPAFQCLVYNGSKVDDNATVEEIGLKDGCAVILILKKQIPEERLRPLLELERDLKQREIAQSKQVRDAYLRICNEYEVDDLVEMSEELEASPEALLQVHRLTDLALTNVEGVPGAYRDLLASYEEMDEVEALVFLGSAGRAAVPTIIPEKADGPSCEPLPALFEDEDEVCVGSFPFSMPIYGDRGRLEMSW